MKRIVLISASLALLGAQANAAVVNRSSGDVSVNDGSGYRIVKGSANVAPGDLVRTGKKGVATIVFDNGCVSKVSDNKVVRIDESLACPATARSFQALAPEAPVVPEATVADPTIGGFNPLYVIGGLAVVGGITGAVVATTSSNGNNNNNDAATLLALQRISR
jgi:hypothetical protein